MQKRTMIPAIKSINSNWFSWMVLAVFGLGSSAAFALDPMGPPASNLKQGQVKMGIDYAYSEMDLELNGGRWVEYLDGLFNDAGQATSFTLKDVEMNRAYAHMGYGVTDRWEVFLRLGGSDAEFGDSIWQDQEKFDSHSQMAIGGGVKATFYEEDSLSLGGLLQAGWAQYDGKLRAAHWAAADFVQMDITEVQIAIGPTYRFTDHLSVYGGPFFHFVWGDLDDEFSEAADGSLLTSKYSWDVEESSVFGGYIGAQVEFGGNCSVNFEYQRTADADAVGVGLLWRF